MTELSPPRFRLALAAIFFGVLLLTLALLQSLAHADAGPPAPSTGFDVTAVLALIGAVAGGIGLILGGLSAVLHAIAPRTKTTADDTLATEIDAAHAKLDQLLVLFGRAQPNAKPQQAAPPTGATIALLALVVLGLAGGSQLGCTAAQRTATDHAVIDCTAANGAAIGDTASSMRGSCLTSAGATDWGCVKAKAIAAGLAIGGCAFLEVALAAPAAARASATVELDPPVGGRAAFESYRAAVAGGAAFRTAGGDR